MFSINTGTLDRIYDTLGADAASGLRGLGNCSLPLTHRAPVSILTSARLNARTAALTLARSPILPGDNLTLPDANGDMPNGWALNVVAGAANFQGPMVVHVGWAKAAGNWVNVAGGAAWESYVDCVLCTDKAGTEDPQGRTVRVYLPRTGTQDPNVRTGEVIRFEIDGDGTAICLSDVLDAKIGDVRHLVDATAGEITAFQASGGYRGWHTMDGNHGSTDANGDSSMLYGYTGSGAFTTLAATVAAAFTAAISSSSLTINNAVTGITISNHAAGQSCTVNESNHSHGVTVTEFTVDGVAEDPGEEETLYAFTSSPVSTGLQSTGLTVTTPALSHSFTEPNGGAGHSHSGSISTLVFDAPSTMRPAGRVVLRIQRLT